MSYYPSRQYPEAVSGEFGDSELLDLREILGVLRRRALAIVLVAAVCVGAAVGFSYLQTPMYQSSIKILVGQDRGVTESPGEARGLQQVTQTMTELVQSRNVAEAVISELDLPTAPEAFLENMSVQQASETQVIEVSYTSPDPQQAQRVANTIGEVFSDQVSEVSPDANAITATVWERAVTPESPVSPNPLRNGVLALALGLMLGVGLAFLLEYFDDSWRSPAEAEGISGAPTFGVIREFEPPREKRKEKRKEKGGSVSQEG
jgi:capsular polysaccharide biosynthesis protein